MNGSTDVRSNSTTSSNPTRSSKTDTPLPLDTPTQELSGTSPREHASGNGANRSVGLNLIHGTVRIAQYRDLTDAKNFCGGS